MTSLVPPLPSRWVRRSIRPALLDIERTMVVTAAPGAMATGQNGLAMFSVNPFRPDRHCVLHLVTSLEPLTFIRNICLVCVTTLVVLLSVVLHLGALIPYRKPRNLFSALGRWDFRVELVRLPSPYPNRVQLL